MLCYVSGLSPTGHAFYIIAKVFDVSFFLVGILSSHLFWALEFLAPEFLDSFSYKIHHFLPRRLFYGSCRHLPQIDWRFVFYSNFLGQQW